MSTVFARLAMTLDGFVAGPDGGPDNALGTGGDRIHQWVYTLEAWLDRQSRTGGESNPDNDVYDAAYARSGAYVMGRRMFDEGEANWPDPPPFRGPVFVVTHQAREPWVRQGGTTFTFVDAGVASAVERARDAAEDKDVQVTGGAEVVRGCLAAGLLDELQLHLAPVLLGEGVRLFDGVDPGKVRLTPVEAIASPEVTHLRYRVDR